jgi:hypothetical protein
MKSVHNKYIFGDLAKPRIAWIENYYSRFVFDDCRYLDEITPFSNSFGRDACLIIHIERQGKRWADADGHSSPSDYLTYSGAHHVSLTNDGSPNELLPRLVKLLESLALDASP